MGFLDKLGSSLLSSLNEAAGVSENTPTGLDTSLPFGSGVVPFGALGAFANKIDKSAERQYIETGMIRNIRPRNSEIIMQEPDVTVLIKKRQFSSLAENYRYDLMNSDEKLYVRATKRLFYNKCRAIAAYERLSKIERIAANNGVISDFVLPQIFNSVDTLNVLSPGLIGGKTQSVLETIRKVKALSDPNFVTTWIIDREIPYASDTGEGTGVFELTTVQSLTCSNSVKLGGGSASLNVEDPYKLMIVSNEDIDKAISEATSVFSQNNFFRLTNSQLEDTIQRLKDQLNSIRSARGASAVRFFINEDTLLFKKVRAIIDEEGREISFTFNGGFLGLGADVDIDPSAFDGINGLKNDDNEAEIFKQVIQNVFILMGLRQTTTSEIKKFNQDTNYIRKRMRLDFGNKSIIQPMDILNIFISSKTKEDAKVAQGLNINFSGNSLLNKLNDTIGNIESAIDDIKNTFNGSAGKGSYLETEKNAIVGADFPMWLWSMMRNDFTRQAAGTCVFVGVVDGADHTYEGGRYSLKVSAKDNAHYFSFGQINIQPAVGVYNSSLYDPLTPFKVEFDASSGLLQGELPPLLDENIRLLNSGSIKTKNGRFRGSNLDEESYKLLDVEQVNNNLFRRKLNDPNGFVYRWKQGIGSLAFSGAPYENPGFNGGFRSEASPALTKNPFAGQDVMNVLSLLVTGQPYNFNTFVKAAINHASLNRDELTNENSSSSYFRGLLGDLSKVNSTWGNFIPFKKLIVNESAYNFLSSGAFDLSNSNRRASQLLQERAKKFDQLTSVLPQFANNPEFYKKGGNGQIIVDPGINDAINIGSIVGLADDIILLDAQIKQQTTAFENSLKHANIRSTDGTLRIIGDDISFDPTVSGSSGLTPDQQIRERDEFRKKINYLTQRRLWKVKANEDPNLFIVDDSYDKNYDIQAFERSLDGALNTFNSTYTNVSERIESVSQLLGLEIFADSQGHIQVRPPQYNRMPSSVFYKMIQEKDRKGVQIFPDYLESLFINQIQSLTDQIEIIEDQIRIRAAALGATDDTAASNLLNGDSTKFISLGNINFSFVTDPNSGKLGGQDLRRLLIQSHPDAMQDSAKKALDQLNTAISAPQFSSINFDIVKRVNVITTNSFAGSSEDLINNKILEISDRLAEKTRAPAGAPGSPVPTKQTLLSRGNVLAGKSQLDTLNLTEEIASFIRDRQYVIKLLSNAIKNLDQGIALNTSSDPAKNFLFPFLNKKKSNIFPEILEHMIEDEDYDDYGYKSGQRYILKDSRIISLNIKEEPPPWTLVEVNGAIEGNLVSGPGGLETNNGGNFISSAFAVDYDMWRLYGFKSSNTVPALFLSDPQGQLAPYAVFLLNRARKDIFRGNATVVGNEFVQAGEVYYIEDRDLLFYAESVTHNFAFGQQYTTSLNLTYGHNAGEYIPTMLDIIGKGLYASQHQADLIRHDRFENADGSSHITTLVFDAPSITEYDFDITDSASDAITKLVGGTYGEQNRKNLANMILATTGLLSPTSLGEKMKLEIRIYFNSKEGFPAVDPGIKKIAQGVEDWILNPSKVKKTLDGKALLPDVGIDNSIDTENVDIVEIDLGDPDDNRSPSSLAWDMARTITLTGGVPITINQDSSALDVKKQAKQDNENLFFKIIDVWAVFESPEVGVTELTNSLDPPLSQAELTEVLKYSNQFSARLKSE